MSASALTLAEYSTEAPQHVAPNFRKKEIEDELDMS